MITIPITEDIITKCENFTKAVLPTQSGSMFRETTIVRDYATKYKNTLVGKVGEEVFAIFLKENYDIDVELDYEIYHDTNKGDEQDIELCGKRIEIKATQNKSKWLLVDNHNLNHKKSINKLPHIFVLIRIVLENKTKGSATILGYIPRPYLYDEQISKYIKKGQYIPDTNCPLYTDNYAIHMDKLRTDFDVLISHIQKG